MKLKYISTTLSKDEEIRREIEVARIIQIIAKINIGIFILFSITIVGLLISWIWLIAGLSVLKHERALTSNRIIAKYGIISRTTQETLLKRVETVEVNQGMLERIFGYAKIKITGTGGSIMVLKWVPDYQRVKSAIEEEIDKLS